MERKYSVSLCMIVKNEEKYLGKCLSHIRTIVDEIIIVDTGSTDETVSIAKEYGARVEYYKWNNNFADARNRSMSYATKDWILILDADEFLREEDTEKLITALNDFAKDGYYIKTLNYSGTVSDDYLVNLNFRLFKNNNKYKFTGAIHEYVDTVDASEGRGQIEAIDVGFFHVGYLAEVVKEKNKHVRNIQIIESILTKDPSNAFHLFNLGNEYNTMGENEKALTCYEKAYKLFTPDQGFGSKLVMFRLAAIMNKREFDEAIQAIEDGLTWYPAFSDLYYYKGLLYKETNQITQAIRCFEECLRLGKPPAYLEYSNSTYSAWPLFQLADIYQSFKDYEKAIHYYNEYLRVRPTHFSTLYKVAQCYKGQKVDEQVLADRISEYIDTNQELAFTLLISILLNSGCYELGHTYLLKKEPDVLSPELKCLRARMKFCLRQFDEAKSLLLDCNRYSKILDVSPYLFILELKEQENEMKISTAMNKEFYQNVVSLLNNPNKEIEVLFDDKSTDMEILFLILKELLNIKELKLFERLLNVLNYMDSDDVLLRLAKLYDEFGFDDMAKNEIFRSIKHFDKLDRESAKLLLKYIK